MTLVRKKIKRKRVTLTQLDREGAAQTEACHRCKEPREVSVMGRISQQGQD